MDLYSFVLANLGEAKQFLVAFDDDDRLSVYTGDTPLWKSQEKYRGVDIVVERPLSGIDALGGAPQDYWKVAGSVDKTRMVRIHGRMDSRFSRYSAKVPGKSFTGSPARTCQMRVAASSMSCWSWVTKMAVPS